MTNYPTRKENSRRRAIQGVLLCDPGFACGLNNRVLTISHKQKLTQPFCHRSDNLCLHCLPQMTARSVLLAISSTSFLRGDEPLQAEGGSHGVDNDSNGTSLARRWRDCDQRAQLSLARANPQVSMFHDNTPGRFTHSKGKPSAVVFVTSVGCLCGRSACLFGIKPRFYYTNPFCEHIL